MAICRLRRGIGGRMSDLEQTAIERLRAASEWEKARAAGKEWDRLNGIRLKGEKK